jgi:hypothetical protein
MEAEEGEITLVRQAENAPELNTLDSILKSVEQCSSDLDLSKVFKVSCANVSVPVLYQLQSPVGI